MIPPAVGALADRIDRLCAFSERRACSDAERRASVHAHDDLRARGHEAWVETFWVRPQWAASLLLHSVLGVAASLTAIAAPIPAAAIAGVAAVSYLIEAAGRTGGLRLLFFRRATQVVLVDPPNGDAITLLITAAIDAPRRGFVFRRRLRRLSRRPLWWVALAIAAVAAAAGARIGGAEGQLLGALQFVPTLVLLVAASAALDIVLSSVSPGASEAAAVAVALELHEQLVRNPPQRLSPALAIAGAGDVQPLALQAHLRRERPDPVKTVLLEVGPCSEGRPAWSTRHHQIHAACEWAAAELPGLEARAVPGARRLSGLPSLRVLAVGADGLAPRTRSAGDTPAAIDEEAVERTLRFCLTAVEVLDADLGVQPDAA